MPHPAPTSPTPAKASAIFVPGRKCGHPDGLSLSCFCPKSKTAKDPFLLRPREAVKRIESSNLPACPSCPQTLPQAWQGPRRGLSSTLCSRTFLSWPSPSTRPPGLSNSQHSLKPPQKPLSSGWPHPMSEGCFPLRPAVKAPCPPLTPHRSACWSHPFPHPRGPSATMDSEQVEGRDQAV